MLSIARAAIVLLMVPASGLWADESAFESAVAPLFESRCVRCHHGATPEGGLDLSRREGLLAGGESGVAAVVPGKPDESYLLDLIGGDKPEMPKSGDPLTPKEVAALRAWIAAGADWPNGRVLTVTPDEWWSFKPLVRPALPEVSPADRAWARTPVDAFILAKLREVGLAPSPEADRRTLIRRLSFDLIGLPPTPEQVDAFLGDPDPRAYENLVERLLDSPHYGERWARHWLDVVHYGDTHGYDKDKVRPNAWPYRDYVIRSLNEDKPYDRFVKEQLAGDWFYPGTRDGIVGLGFIAAGPFDWVGQIEVGEGTMEKRRVRNIDRDDIVSTAMNTFVGLTAQCARCHNHKFDPITQEDYYSLQAVFAAVDRADRPYDADPETASRRLALRERQAELDREWAAVEARVAELAGPELKGIDARLAELTRRKGAGERPEFGYHSGIEAQPDVVKWVQVDLGRTVPIAHVISVGCHDDFAGIGAGFGFPRRYKIEVSDDAEFKEGVTVVADHTADDVPNPGVAPRSVAVPGIEARYVRVTATKLATRQNDYILALGELSVLTPEGVNAASGAAVTALDSVEAPVRWRKSNLTDGYYYGMGQGDDLAEIVRLNERRAALLERAVDESVRRRQTEIDEARKRAAAELAALPPQGHVFAAAADFPPAGGFRATGGTPRPVHVLARGDEANPLHEVGPGTVTIGELSSRFEIPSEAGEAARRAALAEWVADPRNPLTWRSIVNRVWQYHFGKGLAETPNDFGRMGTPPTHPELLDWLAAEFRDGRRSIKDLHRLMVNSATYRQSSSEGRGPRAEGGEPESSAGPQPFALRSPLLVDATNRYLWRMNRQRLDAESIRDGVLAASGKLDLRLGGPGFQAFGFKDDHSPHYKYQEHDPDDPRSHRRTIYRFIVRSVPDPFMDTLDCADPTLSVPRRNETLTALQALSLLNNRFMVRMAEHFAARVGTMGGDTPARINAAYRLALGREATPEELETLVPLAEKRGMPNVCRLIFNANEFVFVD